MAHMKAYTSKMDQVEPPAYLKDRVLAEVKELKKQTLQENEGDQDTVNSLSKATIQPRKRLVFKSAWAVAAVFILALAVVAVNDISGMQGGAGLDQGAALDGDPFALVAYADEPGMQYANSDGIVVFGAKRDGGSVDGGLYSGCLFSIKGENIVQVDISLSRGQIYSYAEQEYIRTEPNADDSEARAEAFTLIDQKLGGTHEQDSEGDMSLDMKVFTASGSRLLGSNCVISTASSEGGLDLREIKFGFWVSPEDMASAETFDNDLQLAWHQSLDGLNGQTLQVTVHYADGSQAEQSYVLQTGKMKLEYTNDSDFIVLPELASEDEPYVYAVYGTLAS